MRDRINDYLEESDMLRDDALEQTIEDLYTVRDNPEIVVEGILESGNAAKDAFEFFGKLFIDEAGVFVGQSRDFEYANIGQYRAEKYKDDEVS